YPGWDWDTLSPLMHGCPKRSKPCHHLSEPYPKCVHNHRNSYSVHSKFPNQKVYTYTTPHPQPVHYYGTIDNDYSLNPCVTPHRCNPEPPPGRDKYNHRSFSPNNPQKYPAFSFPEKHPG